MTLNALALELIRAHGEVSVDTDYVTTTEQWIKDALDELATESSWRAFITHATLPTVASQQFYNLPTQVRDIGFVRNPPDDLHIEYITKKRAARMGLNLEQTGRPRYWYYNDQENVANDFRYEIGFYPIPDAIYNLDVEYEINIADLASGAHIPVQKNMILPLKFCARSYMYVADDNIESADWWYKRYLRTMERLMVQEQNKSADQQRMQQTDLPGSGHEGKYAILDPFHFHN